MKKYKISKYDYSSNYTEDWISIWDIGREYNGKILTYSDYILTENKYIELISLFIRECCTEYLKIKYLEKSNGRIRTNVGKWHYKTGLNIDKEELAILLSLKEEDVLPLEKLLVVAKYILREYLWCRFVGKNYAIEFGYDYYIYFICKELSPLIVEKINDLGLFINSVTEYCDGIEINKIFDED